MTFDLPSLWIGFVAFPLTFAVCAAVLTLILRATDKNLGIGDCAVCEQGFSCDIGEYTRLGIWFRSRRHNWFIRNQKWHRDAWAQNRWNPYRAPGVADDDGGTAALRRKRPHILRRAFWFVFG